MSLSSSSGLTGSNCGRLLPAPANPDTLLEVEDSSEPEAAYAEVRTEEEEVRREGVVVVWEGRQEWVEV